MAMLLVAIVGMGTCYTISRAVVSQGHMNAQNAAVAQLRNLLQKSDATLCTMPQSIIIASATVPVSVDCTPITATVNGTMVNLNGVFALSASSPLFGGTGIIRVGN